MNPNLDRREDLKRFVGSTVWLESFNGSNAQGVVQECGYSGLILSQVTVGNDEGVSLKTRETWVDYGSLRLVQRLTQDEADQLLKKINEHRATIVNMFGATPKDMAPSGSAGHYV